MKQLLIGRGWSRIITFPVLLSWLLVASADQATNQAQLQVSVPDQSGLSYSRKSENPDFLVFEGEVELKGVLLAYWELLYLEDDIESLTDSEPERLLMFRFYPAPNDIGRLPGLSFRGAADVATPERIFIYKSRSENRYFDDLDTTYSRSDGEAETLLQVFRDLPPGFLNDREGKAIQPVSVTMSGLVALIEAGHLFTYGQLQSVAPLSMSEFGMSVVPDAQPDYYLGQPWVYRLWTQEETKLRGEPDGEVLAEIPAGATSLSRLSPVEDGWVKVQYLDPEAGTEFIGYIDARSVLPVN